MTFEEPPLSLVIMRGKNLRKFDVEVLYNCLTKFDNGDYDRWFEENNAFEFAGKIRNRLIEELIEYYETHPTDEPMPNTLILAYRSYIRFYV